MWILSVNKISRNQTCESLLLKLLVSQDGTWKSYSLTVSKQFTKKKRRSWKCRLRKMNIKEKETSWRLGENISEIWMRQYLWKQSCYMQLQFKLNHCSIGAHRFLNFLRYLYEFSPLAYSRHFPSNHDQLFATLEFTRPEIKPAAWPIRPSFSLYPASGPRKRILSTYSST